MNWFQSIFGRSDEAEQLYTRNKELIEHNERLEKALYIQKSANKSIADRCVSLENKLELLTHDAEQYIEVEVEKRMMAYEKEHNCEMNHKWYCIGRQDAYNEMGIKAIEANKRGNSLRILENGEIVELITDLEDVTANTKESTTSDEIEIEDLV